MILAVTGLLLACQGSSDTGTLPADSGPVASDSAVPLLDRDLVVASVGGPAELRLIDRDTGATTGALCVADVFPTHCADVDDCSTWGFHHQVTDGRDELVAAYERPRADDGASIGGVLALAPGQDDPLLFDVQRLDWVTHLAGIYDGDCDHGESRDGCRLADPHAVAPVKDALWAVADSSHDRVVLLSVEQDDEGDVGVVRAVLDATTVSEDDWGGCKGVNNVEVLQRDGRDLVLTTCKARTTADDGKVDHGQLALWDVTDPDAITHLWRFPTAGGYLWAVHHGQVVAGPDGDLLVWGHSLGASLEPRGTEEHGSVGVALFAVDEPPVYLGDGLLPSEDGRLGFVRSVTALPRGEGLLVNDSGCERNEDDTCENLPRLLEVAWPELVPSGLGGSYSVDHDDQAFFDLAVTRTWDLDMAARPFEASVLAAGDLGRPLGSGDLEPCN